MGFNSGFKGLKNNNQAPVARSGSEISSQASLCVLQWPRHNARCCFAIQRFVFLLIFCLETPKKDSGTTNRWTEPLLASLTVISLPLTPACPGTQYSPTACRVEISLISFPLTPACPGTQYSPTACRVEISLISFPLTPACPGTQYSPTACRVKISLISPRNNA